MAKTASVGIRVEPELKEAVEKAAADDRRSVAALWEKVMAEWLTEHGYWPPGGGRAGTRAKARRRAS